MNRMIVKETREKKREGNEKKYYTIEENYERNVQLKFFHRILSTFGE